MVVFVPRGWGDSISSRDGVSVCGDYSVEGIRSALESGQRLFLIGADALSSHGGWLFASDHLALFGTGDLSGPNREDIGPRFPNLRGMYRVPAISGVNPPHGTVLRVPDIRLTTGAELAGLPCDAVVSQGLDLAVAAAHGGAKVVFLMNCRRPSEKNCNNFSFLNQVIREIEGGEE